MPIGFALDQAQEELNRDFGGLISEHMRTKGADRVTQEIASIDPAERKALADNLSNIELQRARERSDDDAQRELAQAPIDHAEEAATEKTAQTYEQYRRQQEAQEREQIIRANERLRITNEAHRQENAALHASLPENRQREIERQNREAYELAWANMSPADLARQGYIDEAFNKLTAQHNAEINRLRQENAAKEQAQLQHAIAADLGRKMQSDPNTLAAVQHFTDSLANEARLLGRDPTQHVRQASLQALALAQQTGEGFADSIIRASRARGYRSPEELQANAARVEAQRQHAEEQKREAARRQELKEYNECMNEWLAQRRGTRGNLLYNREWLAKAKRTGFIRHVGPLNARP